MSNQPCVAIVEDDENLRDALDNLVRSAGFHALTFETAEHFLDRTLEDEVDVILTDYQMDVLTGLELIHQLRQNGDATPAILMTALDHPWLEERAMAAGAFAFLTKPVDADVLIDILETAVANGRTRTNGAG